MLRRQRYSASNVRSTNVVSMRPSTNAAWLRISWCKRDRRLDAFDAQLGQRPLHAGDRLGARRLVDDQLADHRIVVRRHDVAGVGVRIEPHAEAAGRDQLLDLARRGLEIPLSGLRR